MIHSLWTPRFLFGDGTINIDSVVRENRGMILQLVILSFRINYETPVRIYPVCSLCKIKIFLKIMNLIQTWIMHTYIFFFFKPRQILDVRYAEIALYNLYASIATIIYSSHTVRCITVIFPFSNLRRQKFFGTFFWDQIKTLKVPYPQTEGLSTSTIFFQNFVTQKSCKKGATGKIMLGAKNDDVL